MQRGDNDDCICILLLIIKICESVTHGNVPFAKAEAGEERNNERRGRSGSKTGKKLERVDRLQEQEEMMMDWRTFDLDLELFEMGGRN